MTISNFEMALYTILLVIPGFSMSFAYGIFVPQRDKVYQPAFLRFLFFSCVNFVIWWPLIYRLTKETYWIDHPYRWSFVIIAILIISPFVIGGVIGFATRKEWFRKIQAKLKIDTIHPIPTAWDYIMDKPSWLIVTLKDGGVIYGRYSANSFASSVPTEKDIFIEKIYVPSESGEWVPVERSAGMWIPGDQIAHIEFVQLDEIKHYSKGVNQNE
ncbi:DUF6338 family protein [Brevibacillus centrosporus]|jgi:hypothetical protein|uniref:DUF6338 family protein n=1 Tax=Brevibacillus centrosporus TaxID=54910 RepID=UPI000F0A3653|nr:DUF6338 family protein [Brevibacillus centrosporus]MEC2131620.1 DUF6338 family protein [Brevibacillus centrosporus]RNB72107.1 hypothetical protein EDM55_06855 [Brevibacillus centrosporus]